MTTQRDDRENEVFDALSTVLAPLDLGLSRRQVMAMSDELTAEVMRWIDTTERLRTEGVIPATGMKTRSGRKAKKTPPPPATDEPSTSTT